MKAASKFQKKVQNILNVSKKTSQEKCQQPFKFKKVKYVTVNSYQALIKISDISKMIENLNLSKQ